jgi:hypothetical protein
VEATESCARQQLCGSCGILKLKLRMHSFAPKKTTGKFGSDAAGRREGGEQEHAQGNNVDLS